MRLVLLRLSAMGDLLRVLPAWVNLREAFPEARLQAVVEDRHAYVLEPFGKEEMGRLPDLLEKACRAVEEILSAGPQSAMNKFNVRGEDQRPSEPPS